LQQDQQKKPVSYIFAKGPDLALRLALGGHFHTFIEGSNVGEKVTVRREKPFSGTNSRQ
jgi:hypothetical protein